MICYRHWQISIEELQSMSPRELNKILIMKGFSQSAAPAVQFMIPMMSNMMAETTMTIENGVVRFQQKKNK